MRLTHMSLDEIRVDPDKNPRKGMDDKSIEELMASIASVRELSGTQKVLLQPIVVRPLPESEQSGKVKHELRLGFRRYEALRRLAEKTSPSADYAWASRPEVLIDDHDPDDEVDHASEAFMLIENVQRQAMTPIDEANAIATMISNHGLKQKDIVVMLGMSKGWVSQRLKLLKTAPEVQGALGDGTIGQAAGRQLSRLPSKSDQKKMLEVGELSNWQEVDWQAAVEALLGGELDLDAELDKAREKALSKEKPKAPDKEEEAPKKEETPAQSNETFSTEPWVITREPVEIKQVSEDIEFDADLDADDYARGALDALRWLVGLRKTPPGK